MAKILLDYVFPIKVISPIASASTAFLKQVCIIVKPSGVNPVGVVTLCTTKSQVSAITDNTNADQLFDAGMTRVYVLTANTLDVKTVLDANKSNFYTVLISDDFLDADLSALDLGSFDGVTGIAIVDLEIAKVQAKIKNRSAFKTTLANGSGNMFFAFGSLLSNRLNWNNQQYITMPFDDSVSTLGDAELLFDEKISFVINDDEFSKRLALFAVGGQAIVAPYIIKDLCINLQSKALQWIGANQPSYTIKEASLLEERLQEDVIDLFISKNRIEKGSVLILLEDDNFTASGYITVSEPKALWRVISEMKQTL